MWGLKERIESMILLGAAFDSMNAERVKIQNPKSLFKLCGVDQRL